MSATYWSRLSKGQCGRCGAKKQGMDKHYACCAPCRRETSDRTNEHKKRNKDKLGERLRRIEGKLEQLNLWVERIDRAIESLGPV